MSDAEQPAPEFGVVSQTAEVAHGADKRLLNNVQAGLLFMDQFDHINVQRQLVTPEKDVPSLRCSGPGLRDGRSEEHTSELQSHSDLVCRLLLEKKKNNRYIILPQM